LDSVVTIIVGIAVLALFIWAVVFSIKSSRKLSGCSGSCTGCPYASGCEKTAEGKTREFMAKEHGQNEAKAEDSAR